MFCPEVKVIERMSFVLLMCFVFSFCVCDSVILQLSEVDDSRILSDVYSSHIDSQYVVLLGLLDLSAAFDCLDRDILLRRLHARFGICGTELPFNFTNIHT